MHIKRNIFIVIFTVITISGVVGSFQYVKNKNSESQVQSVQGTATYDLKNFEDSENGYSFKYSSLFEKIQLSEQDKNDNFVAILQSNKEDSEMMVTVKKESKLQLVSSFSGKSALEIMLINSGKALPLNYPGYKEIRQQQFSWAGVNAAEVYFTYNATNGEPAKQHMLILLKNQDEAIVFTFQSLEKDFDRLDAEYFKPIRDSIKFE